MVGVGSRQLARHFDNVYDPGPAAHRSRSTSTEDFNDGVAQRLTGGSAGTWTVSSGRRDRTRPPAGSRTTSSTRASGAACRPSSYLEITATLRTSGSGGIIFDHYSATDYKYVTLDVADRRASASGTAPPRSGFVTDLSVARTLLPNTDYVARAHVKGRRSASR